MQTPSLIGFCWLCLPFTCSAASSCTSVFAASEQACKKPGDSLAIPALCWHNVLHLAMGALTYQVILKYKGERSWAIPDTCNVPICWVASGILDSSLKGTGPGRFSVRCWNLPAACKAAQRRADFPSFFKRKSRKGNKKQLPALKVGRVLRPSAFLAHVCAPCLSWAPCCKSYAPI